MSRAGSHAIAVAVCLCSPLALAAPPTGEARARAAESFREAQAAFARRDFAAAAAAFEAAAGFASHPAALLSAADAWERAGEPARSADDCDRARSLSGIEEASAADHVDYARDAAQCIARVRGRVALLDLHGAAASAARVDDGPEQVLPVRVWVRPGRHSLTLVDLAASRTRREEIDVRAGEERTIELGSVPSPAPAPPVAPAPPPPALAPVVPPPPPADHPGRRVPVSAWVAFGIAAPASIAYAVSGVMTVQAKNAFDSGPSEDTKNAFYRDRTVADVAFGVAVAAVATGVVLWLTSAPDAARASLVDPGTLRF
jgi:hypothetical protein